jgi:hypothetical protein
MIHDGLLSSPSLERCSPRAQDAWPRLFLVVDDFGCLDARARLVCSAGWALRPDVSEADVATWLYEWSRAGMLFLWEQDGHTYGYLTGWHGKKGQRWRVEYKAKADGGTSEEQHGSRRKTPRPPGWTGAKPTPWAAPAGWLPGSIWISDPDGSGRPTGQRNLAMFLPAAETRGSAAAVAVAVAGSGSGGVYAGARADTGTPRAQTGPGAGAETGSDLGAQTGDEQLPAQYREPVRPPASGEGAQTGAFPEFIRPPQDPVRPPAITPPLAAQVWPKTERFRRGASDGLGGQQNGGRGLKPLEAGHDEFEALLAAAPGGEERALAAMLAVARAYGKPITSLEFFRGPLRRFVHEAATGQPAYASANGKPRRAMAPVSDWDDPVKANETLADVRGR